MTTVVPFRQPSPKPPSYLLLTTLVDPNAPLEEGDLVAFGWLNKNGHPGDVMFERWWGPTGRDEHGRFVKKGSARECYVLEGLKYCPADLASRFRYYGKVLMARDCGERLTPPPKVS